MVGIFNENAKSHVDKIWRGQEGPPTEKKLTVIPFCHCFDVQDYDFGERLSLFRRFFIRNRFGYC